MRYHRQMLIPAIGEEGQRRLGSSTVLVVGCGALGTVSSDLLARAGVGHLRLVDRDIVELSNLQRQVLYDEHDVAEGTPKAIAARKRLQEANSDIEIEAIVDDVDAGNIERLSDGCDLLVDGLDNFETRYLLNDLAVSTSRPWLYGGAVGTTGMSAAILPGETPCLRCLFPEPPAPGTSPTCDTAGVLGPVVSMVASHQALQAIKLLSGNADALDRSLRSFDAWMNSQQVLKPGTPNPDCPCCGQRSFQWLGGERASGTTMLCGRDAVQIKPAGGAGTMNLETLLERLDAHGTFRCNDAVLHGALSSEQGAGGDPIELTVFRDGRSLVKGSDSVEHARGLYAKYIGS